MSIPKSKMLSASKAIMSIARASKYHRSDNTKQVQNQTVNINLNQHHDQQQQNRYSGTERTQQQPTVPTIAAYPVLTDITERSVVVTDEPASGPYNGAYPSVMPSPVSPSPSPDVQADSSTASIYAELENLHSMLNNYETVAKALILIIDLIESNPLIVNKVIVPSEPSFKELICVLTEAEDIDIRYHDEVSCSLSSKKYKLIEDIYVIKDGEAQSLKYTYADVTRLFDRFNISLKMIAVKS